MMRPMGEPAEHHTRDIPKRRGVPMADLTWLVRVPGRPCAIRVFAVDEENLARQYASKESGELVELPVPDPVWDWTAQ